ncbi:hypothetical protein EZY14_009060 [Kordia sp. TARA_039_SRF]|nr:hypothetical protein EZY14_009060 [Kordia sp. TARA_039_SRF]
MEQLDYCTSRTLAEKALTTHTMFSDEKIKIEHVNKEYDAGEFGWVRIHFRNSIVLATYIKQLTILETSNKQLTLNL